MDFALSEEQEILKKSARDFLAQECPPSLVRKLSKDETPYPAQLWSKMAELGWLGLIIPEQYGGEGGSFLDFSVLMEEMGRACLPAPYLPHTLSALLINNCASEQLKNDLLPRMVRGETIVIPAFGEGGLSYGEASIETSASSGGDDYLINGTKSFVPAADVADRFLVLARTAPGHHQALSLFNINARAPGVNYSRLDTVSGEKLFMLSLTDVRAGARDVVGSTGSGWDYLKPILEMGALATCTWMVGAGQRILEMTTEYAKVRVQFDQPIGKFQAIQHHCANMAVDLDTSRLITYQAAWMMSRGQHCTREASMAKAWVSEAFRRIDALGHQVHGGVGLVEDHDLPLYTKRSFGAEASFGDADFHREIVAGELKL